LEFETAGRFITEARRRLTASGQAVIVGNRGLGHRKRMMGAFGEVEVVAENEEYEVLRSPRSS
jgi:16S rRNA G1207 methylase RsmC